MSFLASIYLWLLPISLIPIIFHFLKKRNYKNIKFSTTRFLFDMKEESLKRINLINILLLIIRTLIILFIILMISKPIYNSSNRTVSDGYDTLVLLLIDDSYSNYNFINDELPAIIKNIQNSYNHNASLHIRGFSGKNYLNSMMIKNIKKPLKKISGLYGSYTLNNNLLYFEEDTDLYLNKDLYIISDFNESIIKNDDNINFSSWNLFLYEHSSLNHDIVIKDLNINKNIISNNEIISLLVNTENISSNQHNDLEISLFSNNIKVSENIISFNENEFKNLEFQTSFPDKGTYNCYIQVQDYKYYFNLNVDIEQNVGLVYSNIEDIKYVNNALLAFNDIYENLNVEYFLTDSFLNTNKNFNSIIKFGTEDLDNNLVANLLFKTSNLIVVPSNNLNLKNLQNHFKDINIYESTPIFPNNNLSLSKNYKGNFLLDQVFNIKESTIKINKYFSLYPSDNTIVYINSENSFLNKYVSNNNTLNILTVPLDINSSTLPLSGIFIPFLNYLLKLNDFNYYSYVDDYIYLNDIYKEKLLVHKYNNNQFNYTPGYFSSNSLHFKEPGFHKLYLNDQVVINKSINVSKKEINNKRLTTDKLNTYFNNAIIINSKDDISSILESTISGLHLWKYLLYLIIILIIIEMYISNIFLYRNND